LGHNKLLELQNKVLQKKFFFPFFHLQRHYNFSWQKLSQNDFSSSGFTSNNFFSENILSRNIFSNRLTSNNSLSKKIFSNTFFSNNRSNTYNYSLKPLILKQQFLGKVSLQELFSNNSSQTTLSHTTCNIKSFSESIFI